MRCSRRPSATPVGVAVLDRRDPRTILDIDRIAARMIGLESPEAVPLPNAQVLDGRGRVYDLTCCGGGLDVAKPSRVLRAVRLEPGAAWRWLQVECRLEEAAAARIIAVLSEAPQPHPEVQAFDCEECAVLISSPTRCPSCGALLCADCRPTHRCLAPAPGERRIVARCPHTDAAIARIAIPVGDAIWCGATKTGERCWQDCGKSPGLECWLRATDRFWLPDASGGPKDPTDQ